MFHVSAQFADRNDPQIGIRRGNATIDLTEIIFLSPRTLGLQILRLFENIIKLPVDINSVRCTSHGLFKAVIKVSLGASDKKNTVVVGRGSHVVRL